MTDSPIKSPCRGVCSATSLGDDVCRGCKRTFEEVIYWNQFDNPTRQEILDRIEAENDSRT